MGVPYERGTPGGRVYLRHDLGLNGTSLGLGSPEARQVRLDPRHLPEYHPDEYL